MSCGKLCCFKQSFGKDSICGQWHIVVPLALTTTLLDSRKCPSKGKKITVHFISFLHTDIHEKFPIRQSATCAITAQVTDCQMRNFSWDSQVLPLHQALGIPRSTLQRGPFAKCLNIVLIFMGIMGHLHQLRSACSAPAWVLHAGSTVDKVIRIVWYCLHHWCACCNSAWGPRRDR